MKETEEMIVNINMEKQILDEEREFIVQQLMKGIDTVQVIVEDILTFHPTINMFLLMLGAIERRDFTAKTNRK